MANYDNADMMGEVAIANPYAVAPAQGVSLANGKQHDTGNALAANAEAQSVMLHVQGWLKGLGDGREKWLIEKQVIDGVYWRMLVPMFERKFGEGYTRDGLRKMRNRALERIYRIAAGKRESKG